MCNRDLWPVHQQSQTPKERRFLGLFVTLLFPSGVELLGFLSTTFSPAHNADQDQSAADRISALFCLRVRAPGGVDECCTVQHGTKSNRSRTVNIQLNRREINSLRLAELMGGDCISLPGFKKLSFFLHTCGYMRGDCARTHCCICVSGVYTA